ncbi:hypothetical protein TTHERM_00378610 (macronuclear) [Tetrahymena thermophila SB210]|uniref:Uncharacterized protein n=1 Tax=Tetrahymena thermophila (strain SB210) TaxID=312017 RepID=Q23FF6_TETTS|nr:hypothetical protein TTHERM_00378610 [Tetrahymena thermophila SB210]EAR95197.3 hypothetical protein TTHERM_00378610 [Tetrahymena thermophila SB210]|eukprot:XP_001015442.3 hypothetical protein TTHERM_00378610 [Tetrahymena thermophila SB210]
MFTYASQAYAPVGSYYDNSQSYMSPTKDQRTHSLRYLDDGKQFDSLMDTHHYEEYKQKMQQSLLSNPNSSQINQTYANTSIGSPFVLKELELRYQELQRLLKFTEDELNKAKVKIIDQKAYYEELLKEKDKRIEEYQTKERQFYQKLVTPNASQREIPDKKEVYIENQALIQDPRNMQSPISEVKGLHKNASQKTLDSLPLSLVQQTPVDKFYKYDLQIKKLEISISQKDLEIANLSQEVNQLKQTIDYKVHLEMQERQRREHFESSLTNIPFLTENSDLKRQNASLKAENNTLKRQLKDSKSKLELFETNNSNLANKLNELVQKEKALLEEQYQNSQKKQATSILKVSGDKSLLDGVVGIMHYIRQALSEIMFEVFVKSGNISIQKKANSFISFQVNLKSVFGPESRGVVIALYLYKKMKQLVKIYYPDYGEIGTEDMDMYKILAGDSDREVERSEVNIWIINSLQEIEKKSLKDKSEIKDQKDIFRLLALLYRTRHPLQGTSLDVDQDIQIRLEDQVVERMLKLSIEEMPQEQEDAKN